MGKFGKPHGAGFDRKQQSKEDLLTKGVDPELEDECRALKAQDELRPYWVNKMLAKRTAARQARQGTATPASAPPAPAAAPGDAAAPPADAAAPPAEGLPANAAENPAN